MVINPVHSKAIRYSDVLFYHNSSLASFIDGSLVNLFVADVTPEDHPSAEHKVQGSRGLGVVDDGRDVVVVQGHLPDVVPPGEQQGGVALCRLAPRQVAGVPQVPVDTLALELAFLVDADLRAHARRLALVDVFAGRVALELVARGAVAVEAGGHVHAQVRAAAVLHLALVDVAEVDGLVLPVGAVRLLVAHVALADAHPAAAVKLRDGVATLRQGAAVLLVAAVRALGRPRALQVARDALVVLALEVVGAAARIAAPGLVVAAGAVHVAVAQPQLLHARQPVRAHVLAVAAHRRQAHGRGRASLLVGAVGAVEVAVAAPLGEHAGVLGAGELVGAADALGAVGLVRLVTAVVVAVADPAALHAAAVAARELVRPAGLVARLLVAGVAAVRVVVAHPGERHALAFPRAAGELLGRARLLAADLRVLVGAVGAVGLAVALPVAQDAAAVVAPEVRLGARPRLRHSFAERGVLVRVVAAVVLALAGPHPGDAAAVAAGEHGLGAGLVRDGRRVSVGVLVGGAVGGGQRRGRGQRQQEHQPGVCHGERF